MHELALLADGQRSLPGGGFGHFYAYAPEKIEYAIDRFAMEVKRQLDVLDRNLAERRFLAGDHYTIADIATWPWYGALVKGLLYEAGEFLDVASYANVVRWTDEIATRPAVQRQGHSSAARQAGRLMARRTIVIEQRRRSAKHTHRSARYGQQEWRQDAAYG